MSLLTLLYCMALAGALVMCFRHRPLLFPIIALAASGAQAAMAFGVAHVSVAHLPLRLIFGAALVISGGAVFLRTQDKSVVSAATAVTLAGALQLFMQLH